LISFAGRGGALATLATALLVLPFSAFAQVLEIDGDGAVTTYAGPTTFHADGSATPIPKRVGTGAARTRAPPPRGPSRSLPASGGALLAEGASAANLSPDLVEAVAWQESRLSPNALSSAGAIGEMQLMPDTARAMGVDPHNSAENYRGGSAYLSQLLHRYDNNVVLALAAYNASPRNVDKYHGVPPFKETRAYVSAILERMSWRASLQPDAAGDEDK
jgi:hypothetical protein